MDVATVVSMAETELQTRLCEWRWETTSRIIARRGGGSVKKLCDSLGDTESLEGVSHQHDDIV